MVLEIILDKTTLDPVTFGSADPQDTVHKCGADNADLEDLMRQPGCRVKCQIADFKYMHWIKHVSKSVI